MNKRPLKAALAILGAASLYLVSDHNVRASDWGCKVILCLSNPGGPTQFAQCRPPVEKLWHELAQGRPFPTCTGAGFKVSRPHYSPYFCDAGYRLTIRYGEHGKREAACVSAEPRGFPAARCRRDDRAVWRPFLRQERTAGPRQCGAHDVTRPHIRSKPYYVDVTIDGVGHQRVWF